jgi:hemerythrin-like domain-containing protein
VATNEGRREFLYLGGAAGAALLASAARVAAAADNKAKSKAEEEDDFEVSLVEDLMRDHGVVERVLLIYDEAARRVDAQKDFPPEPLADAARIMRAYVEDCHDKLEEDFVFARLKKANKLVDLANALAAQHRVGRKLTDITLRLANPQSFQRTDDRRRLADSLRLASRMLGPHVAREDTVLFPVFQDVVSADEYAALGDQFWKKEQQLIGQDGFAKTVEKITAIEKSLGIYDLAQFTPRVD